MEGIKLNKKELDYRFNEIYEAYYQTIYKFCMARLNCDENFAMDCVQETFIVFYKRLRQGEDIKNPRAFLYRTAQNFVLKRYDKMKKDNENQTEMTENDISLSVIEKTDFNLDFKYLVAQIELILTDEEKSLYTMRFVEEMKIKDIAQALDITPDNCAVRVLRLKQKLKKELSEYI